MKNWKFKKTFKTLTTYQEKRPNGAIQGGGKCLGGWSLTWEVGETFLEYLLWILFKVISACFQNSKFKIQIHLKKGFSNQVSELKTDQNYESYGNLKFLSLFRLNGVYILTRFPCTKKNGSRSLFGWVYSFSLRRGGFEALSGQWNFFEVKLTWNSKCL